MARKPKRGARNSRGRRPAGEQPRSAAEQLREALQELQERPAARKRRKRHPGERAHIDEYRELVLDAARPGELSRALLELTGTSYRGRHRLVADEVRRVELPVGEKEGSAGHGDVRQTAARAAHEIRERMRKQGIHERTHYYSARERRETGEIDRTYELDRTQGRRRR